MLIGKCSGTAVWLFLAKPQTKETDGDFVTGYTIFLDGVEVDDSAEVSANTDPEYADLAFSNDTLHLGPHVVTLASDGVVYFDYAIFTCVFKIFAADANVKQMQVKRSDPRDDDSPCAAATIFVGIVEGEGHQSPHYDDLPIRGRGQKDQVEGPANRRRRSSRVAADRRGRRGISTVPSAPRWTSAN
jgi:hypothetical protein